MHQIENVIWARGVGKKRKGARQLARCPSDDEGLRIERSRNYGFETLKEKPAPELILPAKIETRLRIVTVFGVVVVAEVVTEHLPRQTVKINRRLFELH